MEIVRWNKDFEFVMIALQFMTWPVGNWPLQNYNVVATLRTTIALTSMLTMVTLLCAEISLIQNAADKAVDIIMLIFCIILAISKTSFFRVYAADLVYNFESALSDHEATIVEEERIIMRHHGFMAKVILVGSMFFMYFDVLAYTLVPIMIENSVDNETSLYNIQKYPVPIGYTMSLVNIPGGLYVVKFLLVSLMLTLCAFGNSGNDCLFFAITVHLCGQVEVLKVRFGKYANPDADKSNHFEDLTSRHRYLINLATKLIDAVSGVLTVQLSLSCVLICIVGLQFIIALKFNDIVTVAKSILVLATFLMQLFLYSYVGDYLKCQMEDLAFSAFCSGWYRLPKYLSRDIGFVIMRAQYPMEIKAGKFFVVNIEKFMSILKTSMSYLSVLRVMVND